MHLVSGTPKQVCAGCVEEDHSDTSDGTPIRPQRAGGPPAAVPGREVGFAAGGVPLAGAPKGSL